MPRTKQATSQKKASAENGNQVQTPSTVFATAPAEEQVRRRAYEIYEQRGRQDGGAIEDWIRAEQELLAHNGRSTR
jgi:Protein of unknown function (DUF2934)